MHPELDLDPLANFTGMLPCASHFAWLSIALFLSPLDFSILAGGRFNCRFRKVRHYQRNEWFLQKRWIQAAKRKGAVRETEPRLVSNWARSIWQGKVKILRLSNRDISNSTEWRSGSENCHSATDHGWQILVSCPVQELHTEEMGKIRNAKAKSTGPSRREKAKEERSRLAASKLPDDLLPY